MIELILGGARSGKSRLAESRVKSKTNNANNDKTSVIYVATATAQDDEMAQRIEQHQQRRPEGWFLVEEPVHLADVLVRHNQSHNLILVECLTLWLSNLLCQSENSPESLLLATEKQKFLQQLKNSQADIILVSNETGLGVVPMGELSRRYVDEAGWLHQELAQISDRVTLVVAGLEQTLKATSAADNEECYD